MEVQDATKVRLLEAAGEEFAEKGFEAARVRTICDRAGANIAAVNYHFGDKEQLYVQAVLDAHRCGVECRGIEGDRGREPGRAAPGLHPPLPVPGPGDQRPGRLAAPAVLREMLHPTSASDVLIREAIRPRFERLTGSSGISAPTRTSKKFHALAFSVIGQCLHYKMARAITERLVGAEAYRALDLDYLTEHITSFCLAALGLSRPR